MEKLFFCKSVNLLRTWGWTYLEFSGKREVDYEQVGGVPGYPEFGEV